MLLAYSSPLDLYISRFWPLLEDGAKRCDQLGYSPRVTQKALEQLLEHGLVRRKTLTTITPVGGKVAIQHWYLPSRQPLVVTPTPAVVARTFEDCAAAVEALFDPCA